MMGKSHILEKLYLGFYFIRFHIFQGGGFEAMFLVILFCTFNNCDVAHSTGVTLRYAHNVINCVQNITKAASRFKRSHCGNNGMISETYCICCVGKISFHVEKFFMKI
jgi:hypothetical protein